MHTRVFIFTRSRGEFGERDRLVLDLLQPHLQQRLDRVQAAAEAAEALASLEERQADDPRHIVLCTGDGVIEYASPQSRRLLESYIRCAAGRVPEHVLAALRETWAGRRPRARRAATHAAGRALRRVARLLLGEEDMRLDRLTPRQRTILERIAQGETDAQIAAAIGIAAATVNKHLEQIYRRLGVHTRTAAAAVTSRLPARRRY